MCVIFHSEKKHLNCNKVNLLLQTKHGHLILNNFTMYSTFNIYCYMYRYLGIPLVIFYFNIH